MKWFFIIAVGILLPSRGAHCLHKAPREKRQLYYADIPLKPAAPGRPNAKDKEILYEETERTGHLPLEEHYPEFVPESYIKGSSKPFLKPISDTHEDIHGFDRPIHKPIQIDNKPKKTQFHVPIRQQQFKPHTPISVDPHFSKPVHEKPFLSKPIHRPLKPKPTYHGPLHKPKPAYEEYPHEKPYKDPHQKNHIPGIPGKDYPIYNEVPYTGFSCKDVPYRPGMYANPEADCQAYHVCHDERHGPQGASFLCANGTLFNQETFSCDWWYNIDCSKATSLYRLNSDPKHNPYYQKPHEVTKHHETPGYEPHTPHKHKPSTHIPHKPIPSPYKRPLHQKQPTGYSSHQIPSTKPVHKPHKHPIVHFPKKTSTSLKSRPVHNPHKPKDSLPTGFSVHLQHGDRFKDKIFKSNREAVTPFRKRINTFKRQTEDEPQIRQNFDLSRLRIGIKDKPFRNSFQLNTEPRSNVPSSTGLKPKIQEVARRRPIISQTKKLVSDREENPIIKPLKSPPDLTAEDYAWGHKV